MPRTHIDHTDTICCICKSNESYIKWIDYEGKKIYHWYTHKCKKKDCTGYICLTCYTKKRYDEDIKPYTLARSGNLSIFSDNGKGIIGEAVIAKVRGLDIISIELDNFITKFDLSPDYEYGMIQSKFKSPYYGDWTLGFGIEHNFDTLFALCSSKNMECIEILESLIGHTSGFCVPTYVIDAPGGGGKIPIMPNYLISWSTNKVILRNYEGVITSYKEPDHYEAIFCDRNCDDCKLQLNLDEAKEIYATGIEKLLSDYDDTISLIPQDTDRIERRGDSVSE